ncbi:hypothetical protein Pan44_39390 [Caulifigura coniformis]|uniref:3-oxo-tetronate kinase n=1 Tax=Caulifigura coniformis TaxID=2527983 RepID=A0A517SIE9_9PLAN|nr:3-oxo-tetronate kinase [Caulifigura coniformis]QDT55891.1 hypothetical protein Pan44_39390 [Caulifigura coniformis]
MTTDSPHPGRPRTPLLGCIADDFTGASDVAGGLAAAGMRVAICFEVPDPVEVPRDCDALVIGLKTRSIAADLAIARSLQALRPLQRAGIRRFYFKYCSTFDSTDRGNIGPVLDALVHALDARQSIVCPATPAVGRTVYQGHLFVHGRLLHESGMERHPLNPMTDADLVRVLSRQTARPVGLISHDVVVQGPAAIQSALRALSEAPFAVIDALNDVHLAFIADACAGMPLMSGGAGAVNALPRAYRDLGLLETQVAVPDLPKAKGHAAILAGSCSNATARQISDWNRTSPSHALNLSAATPELASVLALEWARPRLANGPILIHSGADGSGVDQSRSGMIEKTMGLIAVGLIDAGVRRLIVAGGETSGSVVQALGPKMLRVGPQIDPGIPWTETTCQPTLALALKSGNFGSDDFFRKALEMLP